jgi:RNA polymerase sigma factor (sigma-70 family)
MAEDPGKDSALLDAFLENADEMAFSEIVNRHGPMVYRVCFRVLANHHESEDTAQAVFAILVKKARTIRKKRSLGSWLHGVARTTALYALRGRIHRRKREAEVEISEANGESVSEYSFQARVLESLDEALAHLSTRQREAVVLRHLEGRSVADAAVLAGCSPTVLQGRTRDGTAKLRKFFAKRGLAVTGVLLSSLLESEAQAAVPQTLLPSILTASPLVAAGAATGAVNGSVLSLTEGVLKIMRNMIVKQVVGIVVIPAVVAGAAVAGVILPQQESGSSQTEAVQTSQTEAVQTSQTEAVQTVSKRDLVEKKAKQTKVTMSFRQTPIVDAINMIAMMSGITIKQVDLPKDGPKVTMELKGVSVLDAIKLVTTASGLSYIIGDDAIKVSGKKAGQNTKSQGVKGFDPFAN